MIPEQLDDFYVEWVGESRHFRSIAKAVYDGFDLKRLATKKKLLALVASLYDYGETEHDRHCSVGATCRAYDVIDAVIMAHMFLPYHFGTYKMQADADFAIMRSEVVKWRNWRSVNG